MIERWRETFRLDPERAVADLFNGRAGLGSGLRLDIPELLYQEFAERPELETERGQLDQALLYWLHAMRRDYALQVRRLGYSVYGKRLCDALIAVQLLDLPRTNHDIREKLEGWLRWLVPLRLAPERDPALECWRVLTQRQIDATHAAAWLRLAADPRPEYLAVALAGLQRLPNQGDARANQVLMLSALLHHAVTAHAMAHEGNAFFKQRFAALRGLHGPFPRGPRHWQMLLDEALRGFEREAGRKSQDLLQLVKTTSGGKPPKGKNQAPIFQPASTIDKNGLFNDILARKHPSERLVERLFGILEQEYRYAETTGDSHFFVRTLHKQGTVLLKNHHLSPTAMQRFGRMVERALAWEPMNPYVWMLWADWLDQQNLWDMREWVLQETTRLFPDNAPSRVELARLLVRRGEHRWNEAERWLHETAERHPDHEHSRVELARLLIRRGEHRWNEAELWLRETAERHPDDEPSRVVLAKLLSRKHRHPEAMDLLQTFLHEYPQNSHARELLDKLLSGAGEPFGTDDFGFDNDSASGQHGNIAPATSSAPNTNAASLQETSLLAELSRRARLQAEFTRARVADENAMLPETIAADSAEGDALAGLFRQWLQPDDALEPPPHAWAWRACRLFQQNAPAEHWRQLEQDCRERRMETGFLRLLGLPAAERDTAASLWQKRHGDRDEKNAAPLEKFMLQALKKLPKSAEAQRQDTALAVLSSAAVDAPQFTTA